MTVIKVLIGVAGVGKSTYIKQNKTEKSLVLSSDDLRIELFGSLEAGNKPDSTPIVFQTLHERMKEALLSKKYDTIFYDATNLSRKLRKGFYQQFKKFAEIEAVVLAKPLSTIIEQNSQRVGFAKVPNSVIRRMYESLQVPRISVDCDKIQVVGEYKDFEDEIAIIKGMKHDSPYHAEDVDTHIQMTIDGAKSQAESTHYTKDEIVTLAELHDLGKGITKKPSQSKGVAHDYFVEVHGSHSMFANHQYVGAMYALVKFKDDLNESNLKIIEAIYQHMKAHDGLTIKAIKSDKLDEDAVALIEDFAKIDSSSRIIDEVIYEKYMSLLGKRG
jgi:metal dependent phosphohydrolase